MVCEFRIKNYCRFSVSFTSHPMNIRVNGEIQEFGSAISVTDLLQSFKITSVHFAVAVNRQIIPRSEQAQTLLKEGDEVEVVHPVGGG